MPTVQSSVKYKYKGEAISYGFDGVIRNKIKNIDH